MPRIAKFAALLWAAMALSMGTLAAEPKPALSAVAGKPPAQDFTLRDLDGKTYRLADLRGKVVLLNFWASWCPPCRRELPSLERLWQKLKDRDFLALAVNVGEDGDTVFAFTGQLDTPPSFPILLDKDSAVLDAWPVKGLPTTFIIDRDGRVVFRAIGGREFDHPALTGEIEKLLSKRR